MSDFETLIKQARELGCEGDKLTEYVVEEQAILPEELKAKRDKEMMTLI